MHMSSTINITEDGEAVGTLQQFARSFKRSREAILHCVQHYAEESVILDAGEGLDRLLILDPDGLEMLRRYTPTQLSISGPSDMAQC